MSKTYINIEGQTLDPSNLKLPASREHRDAWTKNGDVVEVDQAKVRAIAEAKAEEAEKQVFENETVFKALADAVVDLVFATKGGQLNSMSRGEVKQRLRQRVRHYVRQDRGLPDN